ncbi:MAG TPA: hypothetical protein VI585_14930 [Candidatus Binatia bacterium]
MNWLLYEGSRRVVQRRIARAIAGALLATAAVGASAEPEMTFKLSGVRSTAAAAAFQNEMQRARAKVREWWGATFEGSISIQTTPSECCRWRSFRLGVASAAR